MHDESLEHRGQEASAGGFSKRERRTLLAIARAVIPAGARFPAADDGTIDRLWRLLGGQSGALGGYRALLWTFEAIALARFRRPLGRLDAARIVALFDDYRSAGYAKRSAARVLLSPLKAAYCQDEQLFRTLGCVYGQDAPKPEPRRYMERVTRGADLPEHEEIEADVVVIGTGAGGAVVAHELTERGHAVVMLEEGQYFHRESFTGLGLERQKKLWRAAGATMTFGNTVIFVPLGKTVGGSTTINSGTCYRVPERVLGKWRRQLGVEITSDELAPHYERLERTLGVGPNPPAALGEIANVIAKGAGALGWKHAPLRRNAPDCDGQGVCCFGCPTDAKRSMNVSYVPMALRGGAQLFAGVRAERVLVERGRAAGVLASGPGGKRLVVRARAVVVAAGTFHSPVFLMKQGLKARELGRNLSLHPALASWALFDRKIEGYKGVPQGYSIEEFHDEGLLFEGGSTPLDLGGPLFPEVGRAYTETLEAYDRLACFGFMIEDTSRGRIVMGRSGEPIPLYSVNAHDVAKLKRGTELMARCFFAAGAKNVRPSIAGFDVIAGEADLDRLRRARLGARDFDLTAFHPLGTCRLGPDPATSVVGLDHQTHELPGLYVCDGSAVPSSIAVNPQMTIMALSMRASAYIDRALTSAAGAGAAAA